MSIADSTRKTNSDATRVKYAQLHKLLLFFRFTAVLALWLTCIIFFVRVVFLDRHQDQGGLPLIYVVTCSIILFLSAIFSHHILEWDHLITSLRYPTGRWRCHCTRCLARRRNGNISRLTPHGLHGILANRHTWTFVPAVFSFILMLTLTDSGWFFFAVLVFLFVAGEILLYCVSRSAVTACQTSLNEPLQLPGTVQSMTDHESHAFCNQMAPFPFRAVMADSSDDIPEKGEVLFSMKRSVSSDGRHHRIDGWLKMTFRHDQLHVTQHVPFTPVFDRVPQVTLELESEMDVVVEPPVVMPHGMRFDVKRRLHDEEAENTVVVRFAVESLRES